MSLLSAAARPFRGRYRWWIGGLLFLSTVINYLDRQTLNVLGPRLKVEFHWTNQDFALIIIAFRIAYSVMQTVGGRILDRLGTRNGLTLTVLWYSTVASLTALASGLWSFCAFRFLLGAGEAANWPGATKAVSEWFPRRQRGLAVALFDSGSSVGAALAPALLVLLTARFGGWRPAFVVVGLLGFVWVFLWRRHYHPPETHPRVSEGERAMILADRAAEHADVAPEAGAPLPRWTELLRLRQTWGAIAAKGLTDPVWFMIADWFAIYLAAKGYSFEETAAGYWVPFAGSGLGNLLGGSISGWLIRRGWSVGRARRLVIAGGAVGVLALVPAAFASSYPLLLALFATATCSYAAMSTMANSLPADLFQSRTVASVAGLAGTAAGFGTILATYLIGFVADRFSFTPIFVVAPAVPLAAALLVLVLVRNTPGSGRGVLKVI
jgi:ACS family hexuronate transporter-like MFS transporter